MFIQTVYPKSSQGKITELLREYDEVLKLYRTVIASQNQELTSLICFESQVSIDVVGTEQRPCGDFRLAYSSWLIDGGCFTKGGFQHFSSSFLSISHFLFLPTPISWCRSMLQSGVVFKYKIIAEHWRPDLSSLFLTTLWFYHCPSSRWEVSREGDS